MKSTRRGFFSFLLAAPIVGPVVVKAAMEAPPIPPLMYADPILNDLPFIPAPGGGHRTTLHTRLPTPTWRKLMP